MKDLTKYFIDLSKCSEAEQKHIFSLLPEPNQPIQYEVYKNYKYLKFIPASKFQNDRWMVDKQTFNKTELTYPEFIKLFEGGEGETLRQQFESEITTKGAEFLFDSNNQNYIRWLENKINSK